MSNWLTRIFEKGEIRAAPTKLDNEDVYTVSNNIYLEINPIVNACINKIANTLGNVSLALYVRNKGGGRTKAVFHPLFKVIENPSNEYTPALFWTTLIRNILYYGNGYLYILRNSVGDIIGFNIINPSQVTVKRDSQLNKIFTINGIEYNSSQILHIPYLEYNGLIGISPRDRLAGLIDLDNRLYEFINTYFSNSLGNRVVIEPNDSWKDRDIQEAYSTIAPLVKKFVTEANQAGKPMIVPPSTKLSNIQQTNNAESDLRSLKEMVERHICSGFNIPYSLINEDAMKYDSAETKQLLFLSETIKPLGEHITQSFQQVLSPADKGIIYLAYNYRSIIETDTEKLINYITKEIQGGLLTVNEGRSLIEMDSIGEEGNYNFIPANLMPLTIENINAYLGSAKAKLSEKGIGDDKQ